MSNIAVEVFTKDNCYPCKLTKRWLRDHEIGYEEYVAAEHLDKLSEQGIMSAPGVFAYRDGEFIGAWGGYSPSDLDTLLEEEQ